MKLHEFFERFGYDSWGVEYYDWKAYGDFVYVMDFTYDANIVFNSKTGDIREIAIYSEELDDFIFWYDKQFEEALVAETNAKVRAGFGWERVIPSLEIGLEMVAELKDRGTVNLDRLNEMQLDFTEKELKRVELAAVQHGVTLDELVVLAVRDYLLTENNPNDNKTA